jgi:hypothetical protein
MLHGVIGVSSGEFSGGICDIGCIRRVFPGDYSDLD